MRRDPRGGALVLASLILLSSSCRHPSPAPVVSPVGRAEQFVAALNTADTGAMVALTDDPFTFREQRWVSASDGSGFQLGPARDSVIHGSEARRRFLAALAARVHLRATRASTDAPGREVLLANELKGGAERWQSLWLVVFLRGEGDVEHSAIAGVNEKNGRVAAFYMN